MTKPALKSPSGLTPSELSQKVRELHQMPDLTLGKVPSRLRRFFWRYDNWEPVKLTELGWWLAYVAPVLPPNLLEDEEGLRGMGMVGMIDRLVPPKPKVWEPYRDPERWGEREVLSEVEALAPANPRVPRSEFEDLVSSRFRALPPLGMLGLSAPMINLLDLALWCAALGKPFSLATLREFVTQHDKFSLRAPTHCAQLEFVSFTGMP